MERRFFITKVNERWPLLIVPANWIATYIPSTEEWQAWTIHSPFSTVQGSCLQPQFTCFFPSLAQLSKILRKAATLTSPVFSAASVLSSFFSWLTFVLSRVVIEGKELIDLIIVQFQSITLAVFDLQCTCLCNCGACAVWGHYLLKNYIHYWMMSGRTILTSEYNIQEDTIHGGGTLITLTTYAAKLSTEILGLTWTACHAPHLVPELLSI